MARKMDKQTEKLLKRVGYFKIKEKHKTPGRKRKQGVYDFPDLSVKENHPLSNSVDLNGHRKDIFDYKWKKDRVESKETIQEIENKSKRIAVGYNKGAYAYVTDGANAKDFGRK